MRRTSSWWFLVLAAALPTLSAFSCNPLAELQASYDGDLQPPRIIGVQVEGGSRIVAHFDESLFPEDLDVTIRPHVPMISATTEGTTVVVDFLEDLEPGRQYAIETSVRDDSANTTRFIAQFHGRNLRVPGLLITELTTQGSSSLPDRVELLVTSDGDMAGVMVVEGSLSHHSDALVFPPLEVSAGDYLVLHFKPSGDQDEVDEVGGKARSSNSLASADAYDFWVVGGDGLSGNNGAVSVWESPTGGLLDAVLYSNRNSQSDTDYRGFGSRRMMEMVDEISALGGWEPGRDVVAPEDAVNPDLSTATRSICRNSRAIDTDTAADWHVVPTRGASFGSANTDEVHLP